MAAAWQNRLQPSSAAESICLCVVEPEGTLVEDNGQRAGNGQQWLGGFVRMGFSSGVAHLTPRESLGNVRHDTQDSRSSDGHPSAIMTGQAALQLRPLSQKRRVAGRLSWTSYVIGPTLARED